MPSALSMEPYRSRSDPPKPRLHRRERAWDLAFGLGILLVASLARVVAAVVRGETFEGEATLAVLVLLASAVWASRGLARLVRGGDRRRQAPEG